MNEGTRMPWFVLGLIVGWQGNALLWRLPAAAHAVIEQMTGYELVRLIHTTPTIRPVAYQWRRVGQPEQP